MSNPLLMASLAGISAGLGRSPAKKLTGVAKHYAHIKNLDPAERDSARAIYKAMQDKLKAEREAAVADFYKKFPGAIPVEQRKIDAVVNAFVAGKAAAHGQVETDGATLTVSGRAVAARKSAGDRFVTVCPGVFGTAKADRYAANAALRVLGAGVRVNDVREALETSAKKGQTPGGIIGGDHQGAFIAPRGSQRGRVVFDSPDACMRVEVSYNLRQRALKNAYGEESIRSREEYGQYETRKQYEARLKREAKAAEKARTAKPSKKSRGSKKVTKKAQRELKARIKAGDKSRYDRTNPNRF